MKTGLCCPKGKASTVCFALRCRKVSNQSSLKCFMWFSKMFWLSAGNRQGAGSGWQIWIIYKGVKVTIRNSLTDIWLKETEYYLLCLEYVQIVCPRLICHVFFFFNSSLRLFYCFPQCFHESDFPYDNLAHFPLILFLNTFSRGMKLTYSWQWKRHKEYT